MCKITRPQLILSVLLVCSTGFGCSDDDASSKPAPDAGSDAAAKLAAGGDPERFSFFVTSLTAMQRLSGNQNGFGGDLRFGEEGPGAGLRGADKICTSIAEQSAPGSGKKSWRAFLSATAGEDGKQVNAIDRIGKGPWYDRAGRLLAETREALIATRPTGADPAIINDLPNEDGVPNHAPDPAMGQVDNHDTLTGTNDKGELYSATATCLDLTSSAGDASVRPRVGHSWIRSGLGSVDLGAAADGGVPGFGRPPGAGGGGMRVRAPRAGGGDAPAPFPGASGTGGGPTGFPGFPGTGSMSIDGWMSSLDEAGCAPGVSIVEMGPPDTRNPTVGSGGGYGGIYCFALSP